jgi:transposase
VNPVTQTRTTSWMPIWGIHRFYRNILWMWYERCILPTEVPCNAAHSLPAASFTVDVIKPASFSDHPKQESKKEARKPIWTNTIRKPVLNDLIHLTSKEVVHLVGPDSITKDTVMPMVQRKRFLADKAATEVARQINQEPKRKAPPGKRQVPVTGVLRTYKLRMYPTADQKGVIKGFFRGADYTYNKAVEQIRDLPQAPNWMDVREQVTGKDGRLGDPAFVSETPLKIRNHAVLEAVVNLKTGIQERGRGKFTLHYKSHKRNPTGSIHLDKGSVATDTQKANSCIVNSFHRPEAVHPVLLRGPGGKNNAIAYMKLAPNFFKKAGVDDMIKIRDRPWLINKLLDDNILVEDGKIFWDRRVDRYWLIVAIDHPVVPKDPDRQPRVVANDPGTRSFCKTYAVDGTNCELLEGAMDKMRKMDQRIAKIRKHMDTEKAQRQADRDAKLEVTPPGKHRRRMKNMQARQHKIAHQLRGFRHHAHYDAINFLFKEYDWVMQPEFGTQRMSRKDKRNIGTESVKDLQRWSHFTFQQRLLSKAEMNHNKWVRIVYEPGTSKTCGQCGDWKADLGGAHVYKCGNPSCKVELDRDVNGARNNLMALF